MTTFLDCDFHRFFPMFFTEHGVDSQFKVVFEAIRQLVIPTEKPKRKIGFHLKEKQVRYGRKGVR